MDHILAQPELVELPEARVFSCEVGAMKPDSRIWLALLERAALDARECLYIDDLSANCRAAAGLGFFAINYRIGEMNLEKNLRELIELC
jgi:HAD superfamily hydrolase (TIGR01509 family)